MGLFLARGGHDLLRRQPDALVDDLHAGVAGAYRDLLGAVRVAVEPELTDEEGEAAAELPRHPVDLPADVVETVDVVTHRIADAGRRSVFAERLPQRPAPFTGGDAGFRAVDRRRHDVVAGRRRALERRE